MKYKVGDKVRIKSKDWWNAQPKDVDGYVKCNEEYFTRCMTEYCGKVATISHIDDVTYNLKEFEYYWTDEMFDDLYNPEKSILSEEMIKDIAEVVKKHNLGVCVSENDGKLIIEPLKVEEYEDLPIDTPCMCSNSLEEENAWFVRYYAGNKQTWWELGKSNNEHRRVDWSCIIPFDKFNPNNIEESLKYNIVK